jgi:hypothetical protein
MLKNPEIMISVSEVKTFFSLVTDIQIKGVSPKPDAFL